MKKTDLKKQVSEAISACLDKKAEALTLLELEQGTGAFTDYFVICSGTNPRQVQVISVEVELRLKRAGLYPNNIEGRNLSKSIPPVYYPLYFYRTPPPLLVAPQLSLEWP